MLRSLHRSVSKTMRTLASTTVAAGLVLVSLARADTPILEAQRACLDKLEAYVASKFDRTTAAARYYAMLNDGLDLIARASEAAPEGQSLKCPDDFAKERNWVRRAASDETSLKTTTQQETVEARKLSFRRRIYGGWEVPPQRLREVVGIETATGGLCTGTLIAPDLVLSAAHCFCNAAGGVAQGGTVYIGEDMNTRNRGRRIAISRITVKSSAFCPAMSRNQPIWGDDLAVAVLAEPADIPNAQIVNIATQYLPRPPQRMAVVGFGLTEFGQSGKKMYTAVDMRSPYCGGDAASAYRCVRGRELVLADATQRADSCNGDSGGPVFYMDQTSGQARWYLAGVTSRAATSQRNRNTGQECGFGGVYTLLGPPAMEWVCRQRGQSRIEVAGIEDACRF